LSPPGPVGHDARRRDPAGPGKLQDAAAHAVREAEIVRAEDKRRDLADQCFSLRI
jgi:hypothetical protein